MIGTSLTAQRRPGREPRRHVEVERIDARLGQRSTKAGARTPATRRTPAARASRAAALNEGRGANPGDTCGPAGRRRASKALNEGRGANPGDTFQAVAVHGAGRQRSTKAGARTPATPLISKKASFWALRLCFPPLDLLAATFRLIYPPCRAILQ